MITPHPRDEVVVTMTDTDWNRLERVLNEAAVLHRGSRGKMIAGLVGRLSRKVDVLTLAWLDKKVAEFP